MESPQIKTCPPADTGYRARVSKEENCLQYRHNAAPAQADFGSASGQYEFGPLFSPGWADLHSAVSWREMALRLEREGVSRVHVTFARQCMRQSAQLWRRARLRRAVA